MFNTRLVACLIFLLFPAAIVKGDEIRCIDEAYSEIDLPKTGYPKTAIRSSDPRCPPAKCEPLCVDIPLGSQVLSKQSFFKNGPQEWQRVETTKQASCIVGCCGWDTDYYQRNDASVTRICRVAKNWKHDENRQAKIVVKYHLTKPGCKEKFNPAMVETPPPPINPCDEKKPPPPPNKPWREIPNVGR